MKEENFDDPSFVDFVLPEAFLQQVFEFSGSTEGNRGFLLAFLNQKGDPMIYTRTDNQII